jgi:hypothetical protein
LVRTVMDEEADAISKERLLRLAGGFARKPHAMRAALDINSRYGCSDSNKAIFIGFLESILTTAMIGDAFAMGIAINGNSSKIALQNLRAACAHH